MGCPSPTSSPPSERGGGAPDGGDARRGESGRRSRPQALRGPRLPTRSVGARLGRRRDLSGEREDRPAQPDAAHRDRPFEPQASVRAGWDAGDDAGGACEQDRAEDDLRLHLWLSGRSPPGSCPGADQGAVGVNLTTLIWSEKGLRICTILDAYTGYSSMM